MFTYLGMDCNISDKAESRLSQAQYIMKLLFLHINASFAECRYVRAKFSWVIHTGPDIACVVFFAAQVAEYTHIKEENRKLHSIIRYLNKKVHLKPRFSKLDQESHYLLVYAASSHNNHPDSNVQLGFIILLADGSNSCTNYSLLFI